MIDVNRGGFRTALPGIIYCVAFAFVSFASWRLYKPVSPMMWAFVYSIVVANLFGVPRAFGVGVAFCSSRLLKLTVAVLGLVTSALIWLKVGVGVVAALAVLAVPLALSLWLGRRLGLSHRLAALIGVGTAVCGASAIAALSPAVGAREEESGLAVSGITLFGLLSMFLYPFLFLRTPVGAWLGGNLNAYAVWAGAGVHETAQVIAAAGAVGPEAVAPAMLIKSVRIFMIGPIAFLLPWVCSRLKGGEEGARRVVVPLFAVAFVVGSVFCALLDINAALLRGRGFDWISAKALLSGTVLPFAFATAFTGVGSKVNVRKILELGYRPLLVAATVAATAGLIALAAAVALTPLIPF